MVFVFTISNDDMDIMDTLNEKLVNKWDPTNVI